MQIDQAERGFSFQKDGPLDMRMGQQGPTAADVVNAATEARLADILYHYGEEHAARRIARAIVAGRPFTSTLGLAGVIEKCLPRQKPGQSHPATRAFQALRIAVNDEFGQLEAGLAAAERALKPGGRLAVVTFHSLEDRVVKRFFQLRSGGDGQGSRHAPARDAPAPAFAMITRKAVGPDAAELAANPRRAVGQAARRAAHRRACGARGCAGPCPSPPSHDERPQLMRTFILTLSAIAVMALGFWAYRENYRTQAELADLRALQAEVGELRESLAVLNAEWAYLNRPDRLRELADLNFERLGLLPLAPEQFGAVAQVAYPASAAPLLAPIENPVETVAVLEADQ